MGGKSVSHCFWLVPSGLEVGRLRRGVPTCGRQGSFAERSHLGRWEPGNDSAARASIHVDEFVQIEEGEAVVGEGGGEVRGRAGFGGGGQFFRGAAGAPQRGGLGLEEGLAGGQFRLCWTAAKNPAIGLSDRLGGVGKGRWSAIRCVLRRDAA
jgi:hypothetical protein